MNKFIYITAVILFALPAYAQIENRLNEVNEIIINEDNSVILKDGYGSEIKNNIIFTQEDIIAIDNNEKYEKMLHVKYRTDNIQVEKYTNFLNADRFPLFIAKILIGSEIYNIENNAVSDYFINVFDLGYIYNESKDTQLACSDKFINGSMYKNAEIDDYYLYEARNYPFRNKVLEKTKDIINKSIELKGIESSEDNFFLALAEFLSDGFNNLPYIQEKMQKVITSGASAENMVGYLENYGLCLSNKNQCYGIALLLSKSIEFDVNNPADAFNIIRDNGLINYGAFLNGFFNIYNDGFYEIVQVSKVNEQSVLNIFESSRLYESIENLYPKYFKLLYGNENTGNSSTYIPQHCTNNVYYGNIYIFPYNNVTYIINTSEVENKIIKIEVRSPRFFNTEYYKNYNLDYLIRNNVNPALHHVSTMNTFSYKDNIVYSIDYKKQPQSPLGDVDKLKERRGPKITPDKLYETLGIRKFSKNNMQEDVKKYMAYLQKYSSQQLIDDELYFYHISSNKNNSIIIAAAYFYNNNGIKKEGLFLLNDKLEIFDEKTAYDIDNAVNNNKFYKSAIYTTENGIFIGFINRDNNIFVVNILDNKAGSGSFPIYYYEMQQENIDKLALHNDFTTNLLEKANMNCDNIESESQSFICKDRVLLTAKAYIENLYNNKMEKAEKYSYPQNVKEQLQAVYNDFQNTVNENCTEDKSKHNCIMKILSYEYIFKY